MLRLLSLGSVGAAVNGITISSTTNATPIVATIGANHGLRSNTRLAIASITGNTAANGIWTLSSVGATTGTLDGSAGNGAHGGTASVALVFDRTPFMVNHSGIVFIGQTPAAAVFVGTLFIEGSDQSDADFQTSPTFVDAVAAHGDIAITAATAGAVDFRQIRFYRYMRLRCSAYTSGGAKAALLTGS